jgi:hypothetical protein
VHQLVKKTLIIIKTQHVMYVKTTSAAWISFSPNSVLSLHECSTGLYTDDGKTTAFWYNHVMFSMLAALNRLNVANIRVFKHYNLIN